MEFRDNNTEIEQVEEEYASAILNQLELDESTTEDILDKVKTLELKDSHLWVGFGTWLLTAGASLLDLNPPLGTSLMILGSSFIAFKPLEIIYKALSDNSHLDRSNLKEAINQMKSSAYHGSLLGIALLLIGSTTIQTSNTALYESSRFSILTGVFMISFYMSLVFVDTESILGNEYKAKIKNNLEDGLGGDTLEEGVHGLKNEDYLDIEA